MQKIAVYIKGPGSGRESSIRGIRNGGLQVVRITDRTGVPHNGVRPPKNVDVSEGRVIWHVILVQNVVYHVVKVQN